MPAQHPPAILQTRCISDAHVTPRRSRSSYFAWPKRLGANRRFSSLCSSCVWVTHCFLSSNLEIIHEEPCGLVTASQIWDIATNSTFFELDKGELLSS
ncbi:hypothetical protein FA15DRAFT_668167 [Coprinopsis marcescibilis]|uniref:Uncharacterized protein n=1 Tax=Coprinopsis marcescibilis TaxID=230819 RepID=A0A5C3KYE8_COPMA|nr:hypothetical protein FA15DRAFT_668167 [Coprinopsis marcescibilis]